MPSLPCQADRITPELAPGTGLLDALGTFADREGWSSAVIDLAGLALGPFDYVMPDSAIDDRHAAWYSDIHRSGGAEITDGVAILGWRDGAWFAHVHAFWSEGGRHHLGHLLPGSLTVAAPATLSGHGIAGARFVAEFDPETEFTLFRVRPDGNGLAGGEPNAVIATLAPFQDLAEAVSALGARLGGGAVIVSGLGSFAGARFEDAAPMTGLISEILLRRGAGATAEGVLHLPVSCVDHGGTLHCGTLQSGAAPTLVTCELLVVADAPSD